MNKNSPRIMIAGTNSGCGKTTVTCGLLQALVNRNLDSYFCSENTLKYLMGRTSEGMDMSIIEGLWVIMMA